jgi:predicted RNase H-like HicB family nuclease
MKREFNILIEQDEDGILMASVPELHGCHTQARSYDELMVRIREAIELCLEVENIPINNSHFVGIQRMILEV